MQYKGKAFVDHKECEHGACTYQQHFLSAGLPFCLEKKQSQEHHEYKKGIKAVVPKEHHQAAGKKQACAVPLLLKKTCRIPKECTQHQYHQKHHAGK